MTLKCIVFALIVFGFRPTATLGQWTFSEVISRLSQEKAKVVSYRLTIHQTPVENSKTFANCTWIVERTNIGEHHVVALIKRNAKGEAVSWGIRGRSDEVVIAGSSDTGEISVVKHDDTYIDAPKHLDWRLIGLGLCGDIGESFENVCTNIANWDKDFPNGIGVEFRNTKSGLECSQSDIRFEAEIADGFRLVSFTRGTEPAPGVEKSNYSQWKVEYKKKGGIKLPSTAVLTCGRDSANLECIWEAVNEPFEIGPKTASRFANVLPKVPLKKAIKKD